MLNDKKVLYSGMQATGNLTLGNYLGALKNWLTLNEEYECFFGVMDLHSITIRQNPAEFRKRARNLLALYIAPHNPWQDRESVKYNFVAVPQKLPCAHQEH